MDESFLGLDWLNADIKREPLGLLGGRSTMGEPTGEIFADFSDSGTPDSFVGTPEHYGIGDDSMDDSDESLESYIDTRNYDHLVALSCGDSLSADSEGVSCALSHPEDSTFAHRFSFGSDSETLTNVGSDSETGEMGGGSGPVDSAVDSVPDRTSDLLAPSCTRNTWEQNAEVADWRGTVVAQSDSDIVRRPISDVVVATFQCPAVHRPAARSIYQTSGDISEDSTPETSADGPRCPFCGCDDKIVADDDVEKKTRKRRKTKKERQRVRLGKWWRGVGYSGEPYCQRCSEVFRDHLMRLKSNSAGCSRESPCHECERVLEWFPADVWSRVDDRASKNKWKRSKDDGPPLKRPKATAAAVGASTLALLGLVALLIGGRTGPDSEVLSGAVHCSEGGIVQNSNIVNTQFPCTGQLGDECYYHCDPGYTRGGRHICSSDGAFRGGSCVKCAEGHWSSLLSREQCVACSVCSEPETLTGGEGRGLQLAEECTEEFDTVCAAWEDVPAAIHPPARAAAMSWVAPDGSKFLYGGRSDLSAAEAASRAEASREGSSVVASPYSFRRDLWRQASDSSAWEQLEPQGADQPAARAGAIVWQDRHGNAFVFGGETPSAAAEDVSGTDELWVLRKGLRWDFVGGKRVDSASDRSTDATPAQDALDMINLPLTNWPAGRAGATACADPWPAYIHTTVDSSIDTYGDPLPPLPRLVRTPTRTADSMAVGGGYLFGGAMRQRMLYRMQIPSLHMNLPIIDKVLTYFLNDLWRFECYSSPSGQLNVTFTPYRSPYGKHAFPSHETRPDGTPFPPVRCDGGLCQHINDPGGVRWPSSRAEHSSWSVGAWYTVFVFGGLGVANIGEGRSRSDGSEGTGPIVVRELDDLWVLRADASYGVDLSGDLRALLSSRASWSQLGGKSPFADLTPTARPHGPLPGLRSLPAATADGRVEWPAGRVGATVWSEAINWCDNVNEFSESCTLAKDKPPTAWIYGGSAPRNTTSGESARSLDSLVESSARAALPHLTFAELWRLDFTADEVTATRVEDAPAPEGRAFAATWADRVGDTQRFYRHPARPAGALNTRAPDTNTGPRNGPYVENLQDGTAPIGGSGFRFPVQYIVNDFTDFRDVTPEAPVGFGYSADHSEDRGRFRQLLGRQMDVTVFGGEGDWVPPHGRVSPAPVRGDVVRWKMAAASDGKWPLSDSLFYTYSRVLNGGIVEQAKDGPELPTTWSWPSDG